MGTTMRGSGGGGGGGGVVIKVCVGVTHSLQE